MAKPLQEPVPDNLLLQIPAFARDLAWGIVFRDWDTKFESRNTFKRGRYVLLEEKWRGKFPDFRLMVEFGYFAQYNPVGTKTILYHLTERAFSLLEKALPTSIFISYSRAESSAFALLLVERLRSVGLEPFLDITGLRSGDQWHRKLREAVETRDNFICLVGLTTLESPYVREEIRWAIESTQTLILPVFHRGFTVTERLFTQIPDNDSDLIRDFLDYNAVIVNNEDPKAYNSAIDELLNSFGIVP